MRTTSTAARRPDRAPHPGRSLAEPAPLYESRASRSGDTFTAEVSPTTDRSAVLYLRSSALRPEPCKFDDGPKATARGRGGWVVLDREPCLAQRADDPLP